MPNTDGKWECAACFVTSSSSCSVFLTRAEASHDRVHPASPAAPSSTQQAAPSPPSWWALFSGLLSGSASGTYFAVVTNRHGASTGCGQPGTLPGGGSVWVVCSEQVQLGPV